MASRLQTWILAGQSNMEGAGLLAEIDPASAAPDDRIRSFSSAGRWEVAAEPLHRLAESFTPVHLTLLREGAAAAGTPLDGVSDEEIARQAAASRVHGAGLGVPFGRAVADATNEPVGLIPAAHGGTSLDQWDPARRSEGGRSLYGGMLERVRVASGATDLELAGILWYQGETDSTDMRLAASYGDRFDAWIAAARADLGVPGLPVHVVQLARVVAGTGAEFPGWDLVREVQRTLSQRTPATGAVAALDLPLTDAIHVGTSGLARLGRRLARLALGGPEVRVARVARVADSPNGLPVLRLHCEGVAGGWRPADRVPGFGLYGVDGFPLSDAGIVNAAVAPDDPSAVDVRVSALPVGAHLGYGLGPDPVCSLVDADDMALPAFAPQPVEGNAA